MRRFQSSIVALVAVMILIAGCGVQEDLAVQQLGEGGATTTTTTTTEAPPEAPPEIPDDLGLSAEETARIADDLADIYEGFAPSEVDVGGANHIPDSAEERSPTASFTDKTIRTREDLVAFFSSGTQEARDARSRVEQALRQAGYPDEEIWAALTSGDRWIWVSPNVEHQILGTTYYLNGEVVKAETWRGVAPSDAVWFYVTSDAHIVAGAAVRADCGNPEVDKVRPVRPDTPPAPPVSVPPGQEEPPRRPPPPPPADDGKDHRESPVQDNSGGDLRDDPVIPGSGGTVQPGSGPSGPPPQGTPGGGSDGSGQPLPPGGSAGISNPQPEPNPPPPNSPPVTGGINCSQQPQHPVCS